VLGGDAPLRHQFGQLLQARGSHVPWVEPGIAVVDFASWRLTSTSTCTTRPGRAGTNLPVMSRSLMVARARDLPGTSTSTARLWRGARVRRLRLRASPFHDRRRAIPRLATEAEMAADRSRYQVEAIPAMTRHWSWPTCDCSTTGACCARRAITSIRPRLIRWTSFEPRRAIGGRTRGLAARVTVRRRTACTTDALARANRASGARRGRGWSQEPRNSSRTRESPRHPPWGSPAAPPARRGELDRELGADRRIRRGRPAWHGRQP
jgi:hypothetical protein